MSRTGTRTISYALATVGGLALLVTLVQPAGAAGKTSKFCKDVEGVTVVLSPSMPHSDSTSAIASAVAELPGDVTALKKIHTKLNGAAADAPSAAVAILVRDAATAVSHEITALNAVTNDATAVILSPTSSSAILTLARSLVAAYSAAASANAYLTSDRPAVIQTCRSVA
jgi:hypothetical protein